MSKHSEISDLYFNAYIEGDITDDDLVQFIDQAFGYLGACTMAKFAKSEGVDYNVIKKRKNRKSDPLYTFSAGGVEFVKNND